MNDVMPRWAVWGVGVLAAVGAVVVYAVRVADGASTGSAVVSAVGFAAIVVVGPAVNRWSRRRRA
ncbi:hypothetical protein [Cellulomonas sp. PhB150]|uniref:hypothetical protein n=1 Tax=Cellulomonas sp. PhB150 TaxID=2485188 RepID=UPI000F4ABDAD|nr:hypothetical protein [Cellulomonas sp. PhB150]ROS25927.1 hypothetical protein EDF34_2252 [Cellulomonas sp. PhB150]